MRMCDLAAQLQLSPSGLTRRLDGLVRMGVVERRPSRPRPPGDARRAHRPRLVVPASRPRPDHVASVRRHFIDQLSPRGHRGDRRASSRTIAPAGAAGEPAADRDRRAARRASACHVANVGIKDDTDDFVVVAADRAVRRRRRVHPQPLRRARACRQPAQRRRRPRPGGRRRLEERQRRHRARGPRRRRGARRRRRRALGCDADDVLIASTGVIGRQYPMDRVRAGLAAMPAPLAGTRRSTPRHAGS